MALQVYIVKYTNSGIQNAHRRIFAGLGGC